MFKSIEATGKTLDLAIQAGLTKLQMDRDSVSVEVLEQPRSGFFGIGAVPAKVKLTYEVPDPVPEKKPEPVPQPKAEAPKAQPKAPKAEAPPQAAAGNAQASAGTPYPRTGRLRRRTDRDLYEGPDGAYGIRCDPRGDQVRG